MEVVEEVLVLWEEAGQGGVRLPGCRGMVLGLPGTWALKWALVCSACSVRLWEAKED